MRRITSILTVLAATVLISGSTLLAAEEEYYNDSVKDECLLVSMNCSGSVDSIQMRIERLNREIAKGSDVYTRDELNILIKSLDEATRNLETLTTGS